jgi:hypothetical protein
MTNKIIIIAAAILILTASFSAFAETELKGRDLVTKGEIKTLEGKFKIESDEWYLEADNIKYQIHKGPEFYITEKGIKIAEGANIKVTGYVHENAITPVKITDGDKAYSFRDETGRPLWAGRGRGRNRNNKN